jgi:hypothetical protein
MMKRVVHLSIGSLISILALACASGSDDDTGFTGFTTSVPTTTLGDDMNDMEEDPETGEAEGDGDGDTGDGDGDTGDGDGDTGDGDGDTGDGDGDTGDGDGDTGDGDGDPGPDCGNGVVDPGETCDGNNFNGATCLTLGYDQGALTCTGCAVDPSTCSNTPQPGLGQLYSHCLTSANCPNLDGCATVTMEGEMDPFDGYCTNFCTTDAECSANTGGTAVPQCNDEVDSYCELDCAGGKTCPDGMECIALVGGKNLCY